MNTQIIDDFSERWDLGPHVRVEVAPATESDDPTFILNGREMVEVAGEVPAVQPTTGRWRPTFTSPRDLNRWLLVGRRDLEAISTRLARREALRSLQASILVATVAVMVAWSLSGMKDMDIQRASISILPFAYIASLILVTWSARCALVAASRLIVASGARQTMSEAASSEPQLVA